jgi:hypothetical protein
MAKNNNNRFGQRFQGTLFGKKSIRDALVEMLNCFYSPKITVRTLGADGKSTLDTDAAVVLGPLGWVATIDLTGKVASGTPSGGTNGQWFRVTDFTNSDYLVCRTWDGTTLGSSAVYVAKPQNFRRTVLTEIIDGVNIVYTWVNSNQRSAYDGTNTETQKPFPRYVSGTTAPYDGIFAMAVEKTGVATVDAQTTAWLEVSPSRTWQV